VASDLRSVLSRRLADEVEIRASMVGYYRDQISAATMAALFTLTAFPDSWPRI
jgi:hypothetical protein